MSVSFKLLVTSGGGVFSTAGNVVTCTAQRDCLSPESVKKIVIILKNIRCLASSIHYFYVKWSISIHFYFSFYLVKTICCNFCFHLIEHIFKSFYILHFFNSSPRHDYKYCFNVWKNKKKMKYKNCISLVRNTCTLIQH